MYKKQGRSVFQKLLMASVFVFKAKFQYLLRVQAELQTLLSELLSHGTWGRRAERG